jgi:hypothetical protein
VKLGAAQMTSVLAEPGGLLDDDIPAVANVADGDFFDFR